MFLAIVAFVYLLATLDPVRDDLRSALTRLAGIAVGAMIGIVLALGRRCRRSR